MTEEFQEAIGQAVGEYKTLYTKGMRFIKKTEERCSACNMVFMRARDIERESNGKSASEFIFNISAMNQDGTWDRCPKCGDPDINKVAANGVAYQGCYNPGCHILLGKFQIRSMRPQNGKKQEANQANSKTEMAQTSSKVDNGGDPDG